MKRFVSAFLLMSGLLVAGGVAQASTTYSLGWNGAAFTPSALTVNPGDIITLTNNYSSTAGISYSGNISPSSAVGNPFPLFQGSSQGFIVGSVGAAAIQNNGSTTIYISIVSPAPAAVPTLSEWTQLLLGLMVMMLIGWHFHRERSY